MGLVRERSDRPRAHSRPCQVEQLEDRCVPSAAWLIWGTNARATAAGPTTRLTGDFTGDKRADVATLGADGKWVVGVSSGERFTNRAWAAGWQPPAAWATVQVGDFNGDRKDDVAAMSLTGRWYVGLSTGKAFRTRVWGTWRSPDQFTTFHVGDFDGDRRADVAALTGGGAWLVGRSTGRSFRTAVWGTLQGEGWGFFQVGDFNADGRSDVAAHHWTGEWWVLQSTGRGLRPLRRAFDPPTGTGWSAFVAGDFTGDRRDDLAGLTHTGRWWVFRSAGGAFRPATWATDWPTSWASLQVGDFTGDRREDIAAFGADGRWWLARSRGGFFATMRGAVGVPAGGPTSAAATDVRVGDFNRDGVLDALAVDARGKVRVVRGGTAAFRHVYRPEPGYRLLTAQALEAIRDDLANLPRVFASYRATLRRRLGPAFRGLNDKGLALVFTTTLAYELAPYRGPFDPDGEYPWALRRPRLEGLLGARKLVCSEYSVLAFLLFRKIYPKTAADRVIVQMEGLFEGPLLNHAQLSVRGVGVPLLLDPTAGLVARGYIRTLLGGGALPLSHVRQMSLRVETSDYMEASMAFFREAVWGALLQGRYSESRWGYSVNLDAYARANRLL